MKEITVGTGFVNKANDLLSKLSNDNVFKARLHQEFNKDADFIKESLILCKNARSAEDEYEKETKEAAIAKEDFERKYETAVFYFTKHTSLLKLILKYEGKKQIALGLIGREETKNKGEWLDTAMNVYEKIIGDSSAVELIDDYNFKLPDLQRGHQAILDALDANKTLAKESSEAREAIFYKDFTFSELYDRMQFIQFFCYYLFLEHPKNFNKLGLPIIDYEIGALINVNAKDMVKDASITKDMVKDASIT
ncbi:MAG: hypothetical protein QG657_4539 [Acidobacteriota bacterium]|nr:hypothetical protein [Acidobacteriota bacterium]